jgi:DNA-binding transcriptional ArsR family regulator
MAKIRQNSMSVEALELVAARFKALTDPLRLQILQILETDEFSVNELSRSVAASQPTVSKHLKILQEAGFVTRRQEGNSAYYSIADETVYTLCDLMCESLQRRLAAQANVLTGQTPRDQKRRN